MSHEEIVEWEGFAVALVGAAAVLSGLLFVAVSLNMERILRIRTLPGRAGESVIIFLGVLCQCAYLLIPHQSPSALAVELIATGLVIWALLMAIAVPATRAPTRQPRAWHITRLVVVQGATVPVVLSGFAVLGWMPGGLYWLAFAVLFALCAATGNAWVLLVEVVRDERYSPVDEESGQRSSDVPPASSAQDRFR